MSGAFEALEPQVQYHVVNTLRFKSLLPVQEAAIQPILDGENVVLLAPTAGGKTEAALLPLISRMQREQWPAVSVLYLAPTRALLDDLEPRVQGLVGAFGRRAARWHGDVTAGARRREVREPSDVLLTTPESLEAMLVSTRWSSEALFTSAQAVVVDEVHLFASCERGAQLMALLERIRPFCRRDLQRVGLSATVGDPEVVLSWLRGSSSRTSRVVRPAAASGRSSPEVRLDYVGTLENSAKLIQEFGGPKRLVFVDSRGQAEEVGRLLKENRENAHVLHSSLSKDERTRAAERLRSDERCVVVATSALELGIDVPNVDHVFQVGCTATVSGFLQRLGRSGRRGTTPSALTFLTLARKQSNSLLQAAGLLRLWKSGWVEPAAPSMDALPVLAQQILALVLQERGVLRIDVPTWIHGAAPFRDVRPGDLAAVLDHMLQTELLGTDGVRLLPGPRAQKLYGSFHWLELYSTFEASALLSAVHGVTTVGSLDAGFVLARLGQGEAISLGGRPWRILSVDWRRKRCEVVPAEGAASASWSGGAADTGYELARSMRAVLLDDVVDPEWTDRAGTRIAALRRDHAHLRSLEDDVESIDSGSCVWWTFGGHRANALLGRALGPHLGVSSDGLRLVVPRAAEATAGLVNGLRKAGLTSTTAEELVPLEDSAELSKFEPCLPEPLRRRYLAARLFDVDAANRLLGRERVTASAGPTPPAPGESEPAWLSALRNQDASTAEGLLRALQHAWADWPEPRDRVPRLQRVDLLDTDNITSLVRRTAELPLFRVDPGCRAIDSALLPMDLRARTWTLFLRQGLASADEVRLVQHAVGHRLLGHVRDGDPFGHWDRLEDLQAPRRRWDHEVQTLVSGVAGRPWPVAPAR